MAVRKPFEEQVLEARARDRARYGAAIAESRGPTPYSKTLSEEQQDQLWAFADPRFVDPPQVAAAVQEARGNHLRMGVDADQATMAAVAEVAPKFPQSAFLKLMLPRQAGGMGLTPLAASYVKYPHRQRLVEGAGSGSIEDQMAYARKRQDRLQKRQVEQLQALAAARPAPPMAGSPMAGLPARPIGPGAATPPPALTPAGPPVAGPPVAAPPGTGMPPRPTAPPVGPQIPMAAPSAMVPSAPPPVPPGPAGPPMGPPMTPPAVPGLPRPMPMVTPTLPHGPVPSALPRLPLLMSAAMSRPPAPTPPVPPVSPMPMPHPPAPPLSRRRRQRLRAASATRA